MSSTERLLHMVLFESIALILTLIGLLSFSQINLVAAFNSMLVVSLIAMVWNYAFNIIFDSYFTESREKRSWSVRTCYMLCFESGLILLTTPVIAFMLHVSLLEAFLLDLSITVFIMFYTLVFNYFYDNLRLRFIDTESTLKNPRLLANSN